MCAFSETFNLEIHVNEPSYFGNNRSSILDQFISNCSQYVNKIEISDPVSNNDHCSIGIWLNFILLKLKHIRD